jgi:hypothetical protein
MGQTVKKKFAPGSSQFYLLSKLPQLKVHTSKVVKHDQKMFLGLPWFRLNS